MTMYIRWITCDKKTTMKYFVFLLTIFVTISCSRTAAGEDNFKVEFRGAIKKIMHQGDISAQADLTDFKNSKHLYALGAVENLKGEILILDSKPFVSSVINNELSIDNSFNHKATLLVYASVNKWKSTAIPNIVSTYKDLDKHIEQTARENGINTDQPFPFMIEGTVKSFHWHVIDWKESDMEHSHEKHRNSGLHGTLINQVVEILGFYSNRHHAIFTHHTTNMHLHVKTKDDKITGHLDDLTLGEGMILKLPDIQWKKKNTAKQSP